MKKIIPILLALISNMTYAQEASSLSIADTRSTNESPGFFGHQTIKADFKLRDAIGVPGDGGYSTNLTIGQWSNSDNSGNKRHQINFNDGGLFYRNAYPLDSQWGSWKQILMANENGNVGIGTSSPIAKLHVNGDISTSVNGSIGFNTPDTFSAYGGSRPHYGLGYSVNSNPLTLSGYFGLGLFTAGNERLKIDTAGNIGIGTSSPIAKLHVNGDISTSVNGSIGFNTPDTFSAYGGSRPHYGLGYSVNGNPLTLSGYFGLGLFTAGNERLKIDTAGNIGIGVVNPTNKLDVNGTIHSKEVKVDMNGWSDFVFKKEYDLPRLEEVEKHINEKGHLKNIPSEEEVQKNGINLGEMDAKLLQKIEELTLYMIEMKKDNEKLREENIEIKKDILILKSKQNK